MKKIISLFLAVLMIAAMGAMSVSAFTIGGADTTDLTSESSSSNVTISINGDAQHRYAVDVTFGALAFSYSTGSTWNPTTHQYDVPAEGEGSWSAAAAGADQITVKNHSDLAIKYAMATSEVKDTWGTLTIKFDGATSVTATEIAACPAGATDETAPSASVTVSIDGKPDVGEISSQVLGKITVTITPSAT